MKFWELISAFRTEKENLKKVFAKDCWQKYSIAYANLDIIITHQDRQILDEIIPFQLAREICALSKLKFYLDYQEIPHRLYVREQESPEAYEVLNALEVLLRFGGHFIEAASEYGMAYVVPKAIGENIEVLGVFVLSHMGMVAILRTTNGPLNKGQKLTSIDEQRSWTILEEPFMLIDPYSAHLKREHQVKQGMRQYRILPLNESGKPKETELLKADRR